MPTNFTQLHADLAGDFDKLERDLDVLAAWAEREGVGRNGALVAKMAVTRARLAAMRTI